MQLEQEEQWSAKDIEGSGNNKVEETESMYVWAD
jgi:hypothetical protein